MQRDICVMCIHFEQCPHQNNLGLIKVVLHSGHGVVLLGVFEFLQVHLTLTIEPTNLLKEA